MLVLSRRKGEKILIGNEIVIEVVATGAEGVRLGITAPKETSVHRHEIASEIQKANQAAEDVIKNIELSSMQNLSAYIRKTSSKDIQK